MKSLVPADLIENKIYVFRSQKVMLDRDLAKLYGVKTEVLNQAVRRNSHRFPEDFMFQLSKEEFKNWRSQFVISKSDRKGLRYKPLAFTEQGVAMLSSVLRSKQAIAINIQIMRTFVAIRNIAVDNADIHRKIEFLEKHHDEQFKIVFDALRKILTVEEDSKPEIGYKTSRKK